MNHRSSNINRTIRPLYGVIATALLSGVNAVYGQVITTNITAPGPVPTPGLPLQTWVDVNPGLGDTQRCSVETVAGDQVIMTPKLGVVPCDLVVDVRLMNPVELAPGMRLVMFCFYVAYDPTVVMPAPGFVEAGLFAGPDTFASGYAPARPPVGLPPDGVMRVDTGVNTTCIPPAMTPGGIPITPKFDELMARLGFIVIGEGQTGIDVTGIEIWTVPAVSPCIMSMEAGSEMNARAQIIVNYAGPTVGCWTVNTPFGMPDVMPGDGISDANPMLGIIDSSLLACITEANLRAGADGIGFDFQPTPPPPLPPIPAFAGFPFVISDLTGGLYIDGSSQPGTEVRGLPGGAPTGFTITSASNTIRELAINGFDTSGITISGAGATANRVIGCRVGIDWLGAAIANSIGIFVIDGAAESMIGGTGTNEGNVISGNTWNGVQISFGMAADSPNNLIRNNFIGTNPVGLAAVPNGQGISAVGCTGTVIGGPGPNDGNLVSGNTFSGIEILGGGQGTSIAGNMIGLNEAGSAALPNGAEGIVLNAANNVTVGGATAAHANTISGNGDDGIEIFAGNENLIQRNRIGVIPLGTLAIGNGADGVRLSSANRNRVGGVGLGNIISGNINGAGVHINAISDENLIQSNHIGVDAAGTFELANDIGVVITLLSFFNHIGGGSTLEDFGIEAEGNIIAGNTQQGVLIDVGSNENTVARNRIGIGPADQPASNGADGVLIQGGADANWVAYNRIASNFINGVGVAGAGTNDNVIVSNQLGLMTNPNLENGVRVELGALNTGIASNIIEGNAESGVRVRNTGTEGTTIFNNNVLLNQAFGVLVEDEAAATIVLENELNSNGVGIGDFGGAATQAIANIIVGSNDAGVLGGVLRLSQNSMYDNEELGIELSQDPAVVTITAVELTDLLEVSGTLTGQVGTEHTIEFFVNDECDPSGFGEGKTFIGDGVRTTDEDGAVTYTLTITPKIELVPPFILTATATRLANSTSEFSNCFDVTAGRPTGCPTDLNEDGITDGLDLAFVLGTWLTSSPLPDINDDGIVDGVDLSLVLGAWGPCPGPA